MGNRKKMHADQIAVDLDLVRRLLHAQYPEWAKLPIRPVSSDGTANAIYRLGADLVVRVPLVMSPTKIEQIEKECRWLPAFAPHLPLALPVPVAKGVAGEGYPGPWTVCEWIEGEEAHFDRLADPVAAAATLADFVRALQRIDPTDGPAPGAHNFMRGVPLAVRDERTRECIAQCDGLVDTAAVTEAWDLDLHAPAWNRPPVWVQGDLAPGNLIGRDGELVAVIDWGGLGVGDPATEMLPAWNLFRGESRAAYRTALGVDNATWARGRGQALSGALIALPYYRDTNPAIVAWAHYIIDEVLADHGREG